MKFKEAVENKKIEARMENINEIRKEIDKAWVKEKINKYLTRWPQFTYEQIYNNILNDDIIASFFAKDPSKQNISEKMAAEWLQIKKLPASGKNCIRFSHNSYNIISENIEATKSADFFINGYYATQKYTKETGGAQTNQKNDVIDFLTTGSVKYKVMAILDGDYWDDKNRDILKNMFINNPNIIITSVDELMQMNGGLM